MGFELRRERDFPVCVVEMDGEIDLAVVDDVKPRLEMMLETGCRNFVLDIERVDYADSSAFGLIVWLNDRVAPAGGRIAVAGASGNVARVLELSGLLAFAPNMCSAATASEALGTFEFEEHATEPLWTETIVSCASISLLAELRAGVVELVASLGMSEQSAFDLKVAVGEALANAVRHGSPRGEQDRVSVKVTAYPDRVSIDVTDSGGGFNGTPDGDQDVFAPCGRGVAFMRALMDHVDFTPLEGGGTRVTLVKHLGGGEDE